MSSPGPLPPINPTTPGTSTSAPSSNTNDPGVITKIANGFQSITDIGNFLGVFSNPNAPSLLSPNELFDPLYWQSLEQLAYEASHPGLVQKLVSVADVTLLSQKYGPGGPSNYKTLLAKFGTEILFGLIFLILIYAFVTDESR